MAIHARNNKINIKKFIEESASDDYKSLSLAVSIFGHLFVAVLMFTNFGSGWGDFQPPVIYSVTIEGGKQLGGISQVPKDDKKTQIAPAKKTGGEVKEEEQKVQPKQEEVKKQESKLPEAEDGEVQIKKEQPKPKEEKKKTEPKKEVKKAADDPNKKYQEAMQRYLGESSNAGNGTNFGAAALGGTGMGGGVVRPPEFFAYMKKLEEYIKSGWIWNDTSSALVAQFVFEMSPDGRISGIRVTKGSGSSAYDDSVYRAISKASPVPPPPASVYEFFRSVRMTFDPRE
jgi:colicin import membrane protein